MKTMAELVTNFSERRLHASIADFLNVALPPGAFWTTIPGGDRGPTLAPGYHAGAPDVLLLWNARAIFFEIKTEKGRLSPAQKVAHAEITLAGSVVHVVRSVNELQNFLEILGVPLRARVAA